MFNAYMYVYYNVQCVSHGSMYCGMYMCAATKDKIANRGIISSIKALVKLCDLIVPTGLGQGYVSIVC